jgi:hypothetical protein
MLGIKNKNINDMIVNIKYKNKCILDKIHIKNRKKSK